MKWIALILLALFGAIALAAILHRGGEWRKAQGWQTLTARWYEREWQVFIGNRALVMYKTVPVGV